MGKVRDLFCCFLFVFVCEKFCVIKQRRKYMKNLKYR